MPTTLAEVLRHFGPAVLAQRHAAGRELAPVQARAWAAITQCQTRQREAWRRARGAELLNVPYCHLVFTLPHELNPLATARPRWLYDTLLDTVASTLTTFAADPKWLGGTGAFTLVLHTWAQDLSRHLHVHVLMACGALGRDAQGQPQWQTPKRSATFLFPVRALSQVLRARFIDAVLQVQSGPRPCADAAGRPMSLPLQALRAKPWVVYAKTPLAGPAAVLDYLSRYTHRTAIGNERLLGIQGDQVRFRTRVNRKHAHAATTATSRPRGRVTQLPGPEFIERLLQHVVPRGFKRIRHYGLLAPAAKRSRLACARTLLGMPAANPEVSEDVAQFMRRVAALDIQACPHCGQGRWHAVACQGPLRATPAHNLAHAPRGPP